MTKSTKILASILLVLVIGLGVIIGVPSIRNATADAIASWTSPKYAQSIEDNKKQAEEILTLKEEVETKQNTIAEKDSLLAEKNSQLKEKDTAIADYKTQLSNCKNNIETLSTQKVLLCNSLTEIDNKINATTDSVELENLETKKSAILNQIDTLNTEIATLTQQKAQLETDIATLTEEKTVLQNEIAQLKTEKANLQKEVDELQERLRLSEETAGVEYKYSFIRCNNMVIPSENFKSQVWTYATENVSYLINSLNFDIPSYYMDSLLFSYNNCGFNEECINFSFNASLNYLHNGNSISKDEASNLFNIASSNNQDRIIVKCLLTYTEGVYKLSIDLLDFLFTGKYIDASGSYFIDFDNAIYSVDGNSYDGEFYIICSGEGVYSLSQMGTGISLDNLIFIDDNSFSLDGRTFYKEGTQPETPTAGIPTADNVKCEVMGQNETDQYTIIFNENDKYLKITNLADTSNVQQITIEFVSFDLESKLLTFKRVDTNEDIVLTVQTFVDTGSIYSIDSATYNDVLLGC